MDSLKIVAVCILAAVAYAVVQGQVTARVCLTTSPSGPAVYVAVLWANVGSYLAGAVGAVAFWTWAWRRRVERTEP